MGLIARALLGIAPDAVTFRKRGFFESDPIARVHLEEIGTAFAFGYHAALLKPKSGPLADRLNEVSPDLRGFAFEGAGMGLALFDLLTPWRGSRLSEFLRGPGNDHIYMAHIGLGWAMARLCLRFERHLARFDPLLRWLALDGFGFHEAFFRWRRYTSRPFLPKRIKSPAQAAVFHQGFGRGLWFVGGASAQKITEILQGFPEERHADLWSGVGLACAYAGGVSRETIETLIEAAGPHRPCLAQGAAFAAKARVRAGNPMVHTELACDVICGLSALEAAEVTDRALEKLPPDGDEPAYAVWRRRIRDILDAQDS